MDLTLQNSSQLKRTYKIIGFYIIGLLCLGLFIYMDNSQELDDFLKKADRVRTDWGFGFYSIVGLIKMASLISGVAIPLILTIMLIRQKLKKNAL
ncbi:hypothetical protein SAMN06265379_1176 [Saccharicrinis carchari]|uniref:Uncharacterized protein n=1 Tax=Saccharicrinis carchari TaxID=1168039 RepID=A0A521F9F5_SACCC|nr:hypothetical protein SAMN06265379_1176 [Saccharicrinis carchari]